MLKKCYALLTLCALSLSARAVVVYTDIKPDSVRKLAGSEASWFSIDFNKDGKEEFNFRWDVNNATDYFIHTTFVFGNEMAVTGAFNDFGAEILRVLDAGKTVDASLNWKTSLPEPIISDNANPNFAGKGDKYIGVRFKLGTNVHYGWILINFTAPNVLTVKSYAYNDIPNTGLTTGEKPTGIGIYSTEPLSISPNPARGMLTISNTGDKGSLSITDLNGKAQWTEPVRGKDMQVDISHLSTGLYLLRLINEHGTITEKLTVE